MAEELVKHIQLVVRGKLVLLELVCLGRIDKGILLRLALGNHSVGNNHVLEAILLPNIVVLQYR